MSTTCWRAPGPARLSNVQGRPSPLGWVRQGATKCWMRARPSRTRISPPHPAPTSEWATPRNFPVSVMTPRQVTVCCRGGF
jgi:hypothetical protein